MSAKKTTIALAAAAFLASPLADLLLPSGLTPLALALLWLALPPKRLAPMESEDSILEARRAVRLLELHANTPNTKGNR